MAPLPDDESWCYFYPELAAAVSRSVGGTTRGLDPVGAPARDLSPLVRAMIPTCCKSGAALSPRRIAPQPSSRTRDIPSPAACPCPGCDVACVADEPRLRVRDPSDGEARDKATCAYTAAIRSLELFRSRTGSKLAALSSPSSSPPECRALPRTQGDPTSLAVLPTDSSLDSREG